MPESRIAVAEALEGEGQELVDGPARGSRADLADLEQRVSDEALAAMKGGKMMMQQQLPWPDVKLMGEVERLKEENAALIP